MTADFFISIPLFSFYSILASYLIRDKHYYRRFLFSQNQKQSTRSQRGARLHKIRGLPTPELLPFAVQSFRSEYLHRRKVGAFSSKRNFTPTLLHDFFLNYTSLYYQRSIQMFHPYIRVTNRKVGLPVSTVRRTAFKWRAFQKNLKNLKRAHFLNTLLSLTKKVSLSPLVKKYNPLIKKYTMFRRNARLQKRVKSHLIPRQTSYLNTRTRPSPRLNGPIYRIMAGRARAYKRGSRRKNRKALNYRLKSRMIKFN